MKKLEPLQLISHEKGNKSNASEKKQQTKEKIG